MRKVDLKDKRLLYELDLNARLGTTELAKRVGLSQEAVHYRLKQLERKQVIVNYMTFLDIAKLGLSNFTIYAKFQNVTKEQQQAILEKLRAEDHINWIAEFCGRFDIAFAILEKNTIRFQQRFTKIMSQYNDVLRDFTVVTNTFLAQFQREYLLEKKTKTAITPSFGEYEHLITLKDMDHEILKCISNNARTPVLEIAQRIRQPASTVRAHLHNLEQEKVIVGYGTQIDIQELGYQTYKIFIVAHNLTEAKKKRFLSYCHGHPNIIFYLETIGRWNFEINYELENQQQLRDAIIELRTVFSDIIVDMESIVLLHTYIKYTHYPFLGTA
jgi:Lrp/AsnC family transcriptional regulator, leucine-responsive regulatory protein